MQKIFILSILTILFCITAFAQANSSNQTTRKFDEYLYDSETDNEAIVDRFAQALKKEPTAKAYIIAYDSRVSTFGYVKSRGMLGIIDFNLRLKVINQIESERIVLVNGGIREKRMVELYIVPKGATSPIPSPTFELNSAIQCPVINISEPYYVWDTKLPVKFSALVQTDIDKIKPTYKWSVSSGKIISGQGTRYITVEQSTSNYKAITATVEIGGFSDECKTSVSESSPDNLQQFPLKLDEFGLIQCEDELARLDSFTGALQSEPLLQGYIITYGGKVSRPNLAKARAARMKAYLVRNRGLSADRITTIDGGFREEFTGEFWVTAPDRELPTATPTINFKDVKLRGKRMPIVNSMCQYM